MTELETSQKAPLALGDDGTIRIAGSRVTLDSIIREFKRGATAEQIQEDFPSIALPDIYCVIAYFLQHADLVEQYLLAQDGTAAEVRREIEARQDSAGVRERLRQRRRQVVK